MAMLLSRIRESSILRCTCSGNLFSLWGSQQSRGVADVKAVKNRMRSVQSIQKITKAMKMVAASKLRFDQHRREVGLPFCTPVLSLFARLPQPTEPTTPDSSNKRVLFLALTSDKGLCGGVNSAVAKLTRKCIMEEEASGKKVFVFGIGDKIRAALQRLHGNRISLVVNEIGKHPLNFNVAAIIAEKLIQKDAPQVSILHNAFKSVIAYDTVRLDISTVEQATTARKTEFDCFEFEPELPAMIQDLHEFYVASAVFRCLLESATSEQSARMSAMDNASKNAGDMLAQLTLKYNNARQMKITMELIEIISGANAL